MSTGSTEIIIKDPGFFQQSHLDSQHTSASTLDLRTFGPVVTSTIMHIVVIVLGDLGRSPRMQYHCQSLLDAGHCVTAIGYEGEALIPALQDTTARQEQDPTSTRRLHVIRLRVPTLFRTGVPPIVYFVWRIISLTLFLSYALFVKVRTDKSVDFVLVQNPPAIPLLGVSYFYCKVKGWMQGRRPGFVIDWHNLGYSMLRHGSTMQRLAKFYERAMAPLADGHLTVTQAMKQFLMGHMGVKTSNIRVLYDCPPAMFAPRSVKEQHYILAKLNPLLKDACPRSWMDASTNNIHDPKLTLFTEHKGGDKYESRIGRPALITSSTSWTADEDFGLLLDALKLLDVGIKDTTLRVVVVVTGKGPQREMYEEKISKLQLCNVAIATVWLEAADYPLLLACADVGVSLHTSTSGLDLPMKVLDLFGCQTPVLAYNFDCLHELVQDTVNGRVFRTSAELAKLMQELLHPLAGKSSLGNHSYGALQIYSKQLHGRARWHDNWIEHALPVLMLATPKA